MNSFISLAKSLSTLESTSLSYLVSPGLTRTRTIMGEIVDGPQFWPPIESSSSSPTKQSISYILPSLIVLGVVYIVVYDGKMR